jgi:predicted nucleic acid-binding Zn ribbon protein
MSFEGEDHRHCKVCGKVVGPDAEFCSKACRRQREETQQSRKNLTYLMYAAIAFFLLLLVLTYVR